MMGSTIKLLGLTSINAFVALALSAGYLTHYSGKVQALSDKNVSAFVREFVAVRAGQRDINDHAMTAYLMAHVVEDGSFTTTLKSQIPGVAKNTRSMKKKEFIMNAQQVIQEKGPHAAKITVENVKINENGRTATAIATITEKLGMEIKNPEDGTPAVSVVSATSYCNETVQLSNEHIIQMQAEVCTTEIAPIDSF
jgi:hypothetical protein